MNYLAYIVSPLWRHNPARLRELEAAQFQCRLCPNAKATGHLIEIHHRTYQRLGCEIDGDLTALCRECHLGVTAMLRARRYASAAPIEPGEPATVNPEPLFDPTSTQE